VISTSFADIFKSNALKNGLVPIVVSRDLHAKLFDMVAKDPQAQISVDLASQTLSLPDGTKVEFPVDAFSKHCLLEGVDELGYILQQTPAIEAYEATKEVKLNTLQPV
jgi:3-isopropylmalate/(R)-2-methylmalate dehydratase small subunit